MTQLEALYREHGPALLGYLRRNGSGDAAEDLLQETFVQALRRPDRLRTAFSPRAWLFAIARNVVRTAMRRRRPVARLPLEMAERADAPLDPQMDRMRAAIAALPPRQRDVLELRLHEELTYQEIATVLDIPVGTVRSRLHHAVRQLREVMMSQQE